MAFDVNTLLAYRTFGAERHVVERDGLRMRWTGHAPPDVAAGSVCEAQVAIEDDAGSGAGSHLHRQRHFPEADVRDALRGVGLEVLELFGHGLDGVPRQPLDEAIHTRAIYVSRRPDD